MQYAPTWCSPDIGVSGIDGLGGEWLGLAWQNLRSGVLCQNMLEPNLASWSLTAPGTFWPPGQELSASTRKCPQDQNNYLTSPIMLADYHLLLSFLSLYLLCPNISIYDPCHLLLHRLFCDSVFNLDFPPPSLPHLLHQCQLICWEESNDKHTMSHRKSLIICL